MKTDERAMVKSKKVPKVKKRNVKSMVLVFVAGVAVTVFVALFIQNKFLDEEATITAKQLEGVLQEASELTTAEYHYTGWLQYTNGGKIPFLNKSSFIMVYDATASAGIELEDVDIEVDNTAKVVRLTIPKAAITNVYIDPESIQYFDEKFTLLNFNQKEDANNAQALAEEDAKTNVDNMGILEMADSQSAALIQGLLANTVKDYTFEVSYKETQDET